MCISSLTALGPLFSNRSVAPTYGTTSLTPLSGPYVWGHFSYTAPWPLRLGPLLSNRSSLPTVGSYFSPL
jgi:hypothetical protein